jgi:HEAT repeats
MILNHFKKWYMALLAAMLSVFINPGYAQEPELVISISPKPAQYKDDINLYIINQTNSGKLHISLYKDLNGNAILDNGDLKIREMIVEDDSDKDLYANMPHLIKYSLNGLANAQLEPGKYIVVPTGNTRLSTPLQVLRNPDITMLETIVKIEAYDPGPDRREVDLAYSYLKTVFKQGKINNRGLVQVIAEGRKGRESILPKMGVYYENKCYSAAAAIMLAELKEEAIEPLLKTGFGGDGGNVLYNIANSLCANGFIKNFIAIVGNPTEEREVRINAMDVLSGFQEPEFDEALLHALGEPGADIRAKAVKILGDRRVARAILPLLKCLEDKEQNVRAAAVLALGKISTLKSFGPLVDNLKHSRADVRLASAQVIVALDNHKWVKNYATQIINFIGSESSLQDSAFSEIYVDLAILLAKAKDQRVGKYLVDAIGKTSRKKQLLIAQTLDKLENHLSATKK